MRLIKGDNSPGVHLLLEKHSQTYVKQRAYCISIHERTTKVNNNELSGRRSSVISLSIPFGFRHGSRDKAFKQINSEAERPKLRWGEVFSQDSPFRVTIVDPRFEVGFPSHFAQYLEDHLSI